MVGSYAVINSDGIVENVIVADTDFRLEGKLLVKIGESMCDIGDRYENGKFVKNKEAAVSTPTPEERLEALEMALLELL